MPYQAPQDWESLATFLALVMATISAYVDLVTLLQG
jgi:hypothetical protein